MKTFTMVFLAVGLCGLVCLSGCGESGTTVDAQLVSQHREEFLLESEPDGVIGITELREKLEGSKDTEAHDHDEHDHDGHDHDEHDHDGHDQDGEGHAGHDQDGHDHEDHDQDADEHGEHGEHGDHEHGDHGEEDYEHAEHEHGEHEHAAHEGGIGSLSGIAVVGKISQETADGGASASDFPWEKGEAAFVIVDPASEGGEEEHQHGDGEDCPFCAKKTIEAQAVVQFGSDSGTIKVDARDLFGLQVDDIVVVRGDAAVKGGVLIIDADGIYVRR